MIDRSLNSEEEAFRMVETEIHSPPVSSRRQLLNGVKAELPLLVGVFPFGLIYAASAIQIGISKSAIQAMSAILFAGSSQFLAVQMAAAITPGLVMVLAIFTINLRHALYSASVAPYIQHLNGRWKALLAYLLTDEAYAVVITRFQRDGKSPNGHWFYLGAGLTLWVTWQISTAVGVYLGAIIPPDWPLDFALPLTFIAMVVPALKDRTSLGAALSAGLAAVLLYTLPFKLSIPISALIGIWVGMSLEGRK